MAEINLVSENREPEINSSALSTKAAWFIGCISFYRPELFSSSSHVKDQLAI